MTLHSTGSAPAGGLLKKRLSVRTVDVHAHLLSPAWWKEGTLSRPSGQRERLELNLSEAEKQEYAGRAQKRREAADLRHQAVYFLSEMDEAGVDLMVNHTMDHTEFPGAGGRLYKVPFEQVLEECATLRETFPGRLELFCGVDPRRGPARSVALFERAVKEYGALGLGEMISTQMYTLEDWIAAILRHAEEEGEPFSDEDLALFFSTNALRYLGLAKSRETA